MTGTREVAGSAARGAGKGTGQTRDREECEFEISRVQLAVI